jgi:hypothetical protein
MLVVVMYRCVYYCRLLLDYLNYLMNLMRLLVVFLCCVLVVLAHLKQKESILTVLKIKCKNKIFFLPYLLFLERFLGDFKKKKNFIKFNKGFLMILSVETKKLFEKKINKREHFLLF